MGRLIDAERKVHIQIYDDEHEEYRTHEMSISDVLDTYTDEGCPDAEPSEQQWIPCERELPDVGRSVLISVGGMYTAEGCLREDGDWTQFRWDAIQRKDMVGAWKPLEEPWEGEQQ